jgi:hypothetical protein
MDDDRVTTARILRQNAQTSLKGASAICHRSDGTVSTRSVCFSRDRQVVMAVGGAQLTYGARRVSRGRFRVGRLSSVPVGIYGWSPAVFGYDTLTSGQDERRPISFSAGPRTRPEGRARRPKRESDIRPLAD